MKTESLITPHGGRLINRMVESSRAEALAAEAAAMQSITLSTKQACDLEMTATGAFSPLTGFVGKADFDSICSNLRFADGTVWPIPITLAVDDEVKAALRPGQQAALKHEDGTLLAVLDIQDIYPHDKTLEIPKVFGTEDEAHPGVKGVMEEGEWLVAGPIQVITVTPDV